eukprot:CAMPEP_0176346496 /NCGR_PEP_ID=MMETSP0126-20121128/6278_1 /TAXON_ID=141414 ORGANISM="Strombidinopsis acuminatum, Strain SPMC142" /NCGR_SAMPLE_ID=MMETSP0126 /ASSEMBLY_ACC=CAM_ASM_000229 /LENGTH=62 /DNA_ID=CAMNT_0017694055 /DNA_START=1105 /DNA_END=1293 /DNA_ORIENTATION=+
MVTALSTVECTNDAILNESLKEVADFLHSTPAKFWVSISFQLILFFIEIYQFVMDRIQKIPD